MLTLMRRWRPSPSRSGVASAAWIFCSISITSSDSGLFSNKHDEFIAAQAGQGIGFAQASPDPACHGLQQQVAAGMAVAGH